MAGGALRPVRLLELWLGRLCRVLALLGAVVLVVAACVVVVSVTGRYLFSTPIHGEIEILALCMAVAVSLFLPYCQVRRGHVIVSVFTDRAPLWLRAGLDALGGLGIAVVAGVLAWRMGIGGYEMHIYRDQSMVLRIPTWWAFAVTVPCLALFALAGLVTMLRELEEPWGGSREETPAS